MSTITHTTTVSLDDSSVEVLIKFGEDDEIELEVKNSDEETLTLAVSKSELLELADSIYDLFDEENEEEEEE